MHFIRGTITNVTAYGDGIKGEVDVWVEVNYISYDITIILLRLPNGSKSDAVEVADFTITYQAYGDTQDQSAIFTCPEVNNGDKLELVAASDQESVLPYTILTYTVREDSE